MLYTSKFYEFVTSIQFFEGSYSLKTGKLYAKSIQMRSCHGIYEGKQVGKGRVCQSEMTQTLLGGRESLLVN